MDFQRVIAKRRSLRAYASRPVEPDKIERMLEAARWSPSCANRQPWRFVVVGRDAPTRISVEEALHPENAWANQAPVIVAAARRRDGAVVESREYYLVDMGMALMSLIYRGVDQGLQVHPIAGWGKDPLRAALGMPLDVVPVALVAVGYPGKAETLDEEARKRDEKPPVRRALARIAFQGRWEEPYECVLPRRPAKVYKFDLQLQFGDVDAIGYVNGAKIFNYLEMGRVRFFADLFGGGRVEDPRFILAEVSCRYLIPIRLQDRVRVRMYISDVSQSSFRFRYQLVDSDDRRVFVAAESVQVMYDYVARHRVPIDADFLARVRDYIGG